MSDLNIKILDLIDKKYTVNEMVTELGISRDQLYKVFRKLKKLGMNFNKKYYSSGDIIYVPNKEIYIPPKCNQVDIITEPKTDSFRALLISDLHIGNELECAIAWQKIYDYCIVNNIHIIIIAGDFLDGISIGRKESKLHNHPFQQMEYAARNYPFDPGILNFIILGNHDIDSLISFGVDFIEYLKNFRHDIVPIGYGSGIINVKNDKILLAHPLGIGVSCEHDLTSNFLLLKGHHHAFRSIIGANGSCSISVPSLSNIFTSENEFLPGAIDLSIKFKDGYFETIYYEHLLIGDKIYAVGSMQHSVCFEKDKRFDTPIRHEEHLVKKKAKNKEKK
ncbi:MAG: metallophosphoesterase [Bacilli bacterium]|nr:metallophosphoesterase [Bacilli bacterium]